MPKKRGLHVIPEQDKRLENGLTDTGNSLLWAFVPLFGLITVIGLGVDTVIWELGFFSRYNVKLLTCQCVLSKDMYVLKMSQQTSADIIQQIVYLSQMFAPVCPCPV